MYSPNPGSYHTEVSTSLPSGSLEGEATVTAQEWMETSAVLKFMLVMLLVAFALLKSELQSSESCV